MKKNKLLYLPVILLGILVFTSCKKDAFNINKNPNVPTDSTIAYQTILPAALNNTANAVGLNWGWLQNWMGFWARSGSFAPNATEESYNVTSGFQNGIWSSLYDNNYDYQIIQNLAKKEGAKFYEGVARLMKAHNFQILVDVYNNIPYFGALKGNANPTPKYDNGLDIYKDLFKQIDTAQALFVATDLTTSVHKDAKTDDIVFAGDLLKWKKLCNTLRLRLLIHLSGVTGFNVAAETAKITADGSGYLGAGETAEANPGYKSDKPNAFWATYIKDQAGTATGNNNFFRANSYAIGYYGFNGDPRRSLFYSSVGGAYVGVAYGAAPVTANGTSKLSGIGTALGRGETFGQWILTSTESLFLQAEARQRGYIPGSAAVTYTNAVTESFIWANIPSAASLAVATSTGTAQAAAYLSGNATYPDVDFSVSSSYAGLGGGLYAILSQKWFALNGVAPFEIWTDFRRTKMKYGSDPLVGFSQGPPLSISPSNNSTVIPRRLIYPQSEYNYNAANVGGQGAINAFTNKIFWDN
jgi:Starch-binding associating with outer membrane